LVFLLNFSAFYQRTEIYKINKKENKRKNWVINADTDGDWCKAGIEDNLDIF
jgi:hypothetical protein